jgi:hypothetical protein
MLSYHTSALRRKERSRALLALQGETMKTDGATGIQERRAKTASKMIEE